MNIHRLLRKAMFHTVNTAMMLPALIFSGIYALMTFVADKTYSPNVFVAMQYMDRFDTYMVNTVWKLERWAYYSQEFSEDDKEN